MRMGCFIYQRLAQVRLIRGLSTVPSKHVRVRRRHARMNLALSSKFAHELSDFVVVLLPFGNLTRSRQLRLFLCSDGFVSSVDMKVARDDAP